MNIIIIIIIIVVIFVDLYAELYILGPITESTDTKPQHKHADEYKQTRNTLNKLILSKFKLKLLRTTITRTIIIHFIFGVLANSVGLLHSKTKIHTKHKEIQK
jgi:hypothetical protein